MKPLLSAQPVTIEGARPSNELVQIIQDAARDISALRSDVDGAFPNGRLVARVNFNGTGVVAIREAANVASITDLGTGLYLVTFATPLPRASYTIAPAASNGCFVVIGSLSVFSFVVATVNASGAAVDPETVTLSVFL